MNRARLKLPDDIEVRIDDGEAGRQAWLEWRATYRPLPHPLEPVDAPYDGLLLHYEGPDHDHVCSQPGPFVWTLIEGDFGTYIVAGYHRVNRLGYFITEVGHA